MSWGIKIDLLKLKNAFVTTLTGKTATKKCIIIPIDDEPSIFLGEKGCHLSLTGIKIAEPKFQDTHCVKPSYPKEIIEGMSEEARKQIPIVGGMHEFGPKTMEVKDNLQEQGIQQPPVDDLPF